MSKATEIAVIALLGILVGAIFGCEVILIDIKHELQQLNAQQHSEGGVK